MVEASQWYSIVSIGSASLALLLSAYVMRRIPNRRAGDTFILAMIFFVLAGVFAYLLRTSVVIEDEPNPGPLAIARLFYFFHMLAVGFTASFIGQYFLGFAALRRRVVNLFLQIVLLVVAIGVTTQVTTLENEVPFGVVVEDPSAVGGLALFATIFMATALGVLVRTLIRNKDAVVRKQALLMTAGVVVHGIGAESYAYSRVFADLYPPPLLTITAFAMAALFSVAVLRYRMFVVAPTSEERIALPRRFDIKAGRGYSFRERNPKLLFLALSEAVRGGAQGLAVTRRTAREMKEDFDLETTPVLSLTSVLGQNHVPPTDPDLLVRLVREFVAAQPHAVVAMEGIEYLAGYHPSDRVVKLINDLRDLVISGGGILLVSADPPSMDQALASLVERDFEPLGIGAKAGYAIEDVFVIESSGVLLTHASNSETAGLDPDVLAGMLTAIMNFVRVSFAEGADQLRRLELGEKTVVLERSPRFILAVAALGVPPAEIREEMRVFLDRAERRYGPLLAQWNGDPGEFSGLETMTSRLFL